MRAKEQLRDHDDAGKENEQNRVEGKLNINGESNIFFDVSYLPRTIERTTRSFRQ